MTEEKKEASKEAPKEAPAAQGAPQAAPAAPQEAPAAAVPEKKEAVPVKKEKPSNCASCNKSIRKKRWYYRNGKFYCTKVCWANAVKKESAKETPQETKQ